MRHKQTIASVEQCLTLMVQYEPTHDGNNVYILSIPLDLSSSEKREILQLALDALQHDNDDDDALNAAFRNAAEGLDVLDDEARQDALDDPLVYESLDDETSDHEGGNASPFVDESAANAKQRTALGTFTYNADGKPQRMGQARRKATKKHST